MSLECETVTAEDKKKILIKIAECPNPNMRKYTTEQKISDSKLVYFSWLQTREWLEDIGRKIVGEAGFRLIKEIIEIPGIEAVFINTFELKVVKRKDLIWTRLEPRILKTIKEHIGTIKQR